jgi:phage protein D
MRQQHLPQFYLKIAGSDVPRWLGDAIVECVVENSLHLPDACSIRLHVDPIDDHQLKVLDNDLIREGKEVEISGGYGNDLKPLFHGEITSIEVDLSAFGLSSLTVRCMNLGHRLHRGRKRQTFLQVTDADIVKKVGQSAGLTVVAESTPNIYEWVLQNNETDWEFLSKLAQRAGARLYVKGKEELRFEHVKDSAGETLKLTWGRELRSFRPRTAASPQVNKVIVRGWDMRGKQAVVGTSKEPRGNPKTKESKLGPDVGTSAYGSATMVVVDRPVATMGEAEALAQSLFDEISGEFLEADGLCTGLPDLLAGKTVEIDNIGSRFGGKYFVTSTTHTYTPAEGYATQFAVDGKRATTLLSTLRVFDGSDRAPLGSQIVVGIVTNNEDPDNLGRVKVRYPWLDEKEESHWARIASPMAGPNRGLYILPEIDDEVLVAFEHGDIHRPFVLGALWNGVDTPVEGNSAAVKGAKVNRRTLKTRIGHTVLLDDTDGKGEMRLTTANGHFLTLDDKNKQVTARSRTGHTVTLDDDKNLVLVVDKSGNNKMTIKTGDNSITFECNGNFKVAAKGKVSVEGKQGIELTTPMNIDVKATSKLSMQGQAGVDVKTPAMMTLEATGMTTLKASGILTIQGSLVKIN